MNSKEFRDKPISHVFSQYSENAPVYFIGNKLGLLKLKEAIDKALSSSSGIGQSYALSADMEEFPISAILVEDSRGSWEDMELPYTAYYSADNRPGVLSPSDIWFRRTNEGLDDPYLP